MPRPPSIPETDEERRAMILRLIKANNPRRQLFDGIWWSGEKLLGIKSHAAAEIEHISWAAVVAMVEKAEAKQKKPTRAPRLFKTKRSARK